MRKKWMVVGLALGLSVPVAFVAHPASAATSDAIAQALVTATLQNLGLGELSPDLSQQLVGQLTDAIDAGVIDPTISAQVASLLENPALISGLSDVFSAHLDDQTSAWKTSVLAPNDSNGIIGGDDVTDSEGTQNSENVDDNSDGQGADNSDNSGEESGTGDGSTSGGDDANSPGRDGSSGTDDSSDDNSDDDQGDNGDYEDDSIDG
jgi:hypothetical protein